MAVRNVSLKDEAYNRLRAARRYPGESFSEVVLRATWPEDTITSAGLLATLRSRRDNPKRADGTYRPGRLGRDATVEEAYADARLTGLNLLAVAKSALGELDRIEALKAADRPPEDKWVER